MSYKKQLYDVLRSLTEDQAQIYTYLEAVVLSVGQTPEGYMDAKAAIDAMSKAMQLTHKTWQQTNLH